MIKQISHQNFLTTPFIAIKEWNLYNIDNPDLILLEPQSASVYISDTSVAIDYVDYHGVSPVLNRDCNISLEQQETNLSAVEEGISGSGRFYPDTDDRNSDGTYKRLVYSQINNAFYNTYQNPMKIFGLDNIDFPLSKTNRFLSDNFLVFTIPQIIFGDKMVAGSVQFFDASFDDNISITDDSYGNLIATSNLFSRVQEVRSLGNNIIDGPSNHPCGDG